MRSTRRRDQTLADSFISLPDPARIPKNRHGGLDMAVVLNVAILFFLVYLFFAFCVKRTGMQAEEDFSLTCCHCQLTTEAREISKQGKPHVHCPCDKCNGRATWRMTAWRHLQSKREQSSQPTPVKKARRTLEEPECSTLELPVEYEGHEFEHVFRFADSYSEFPHCGDVCAGAEHADHDHGVVLVNDWFIRQQTIQVWFPGLIGLSCATSDFPINYHQNQLGVILVNDWFISH